MDNFIISFATMMPLEHLIEKMEEAITKYKIEGETPTVINELGSISSMVMVKCTVTKRSTDNNTDIVEEAMKLGKDLEKMQSRDRLFEPTKS